MKLSKMIERGSEKFKGYCIGEWIRGNGGKPMGCAMTAAFFSVTDYDLKTVLALGDIEALGDIISAWGLALEIDVDKVIGINDDLVSQKKRVTWGDVISSIKESDIDIDVDYKEAKKLAKRPKELVR